MGRQLARELQQVTARLRQGRHLGKQPRDVSGGQGQRDLRKRGSRYLAQHVLGRVKGDGASRIGGKALEVRQGIAHAAARVEHHQLERLTVIAEPLALTDVDEASEQLIVADGAEVKALHARKDGLENLLRVSGAHHEDDVLGRLFQRLEQRVERRRGQHVDLVDDIDLVVATNWSVAHTIDDLLAHVVHAGVGGGVELIHVRMLARGDELAVFAGAIGKVSSSLLAEERLCKQASHRGLARSARSAEQVRMAGASLKHGTAQRCHHVLLAHNVVKRLGTILPVERFHGASGLANCPRKVIGDKYTAPRQRGTVAHGALNRSTAAPVSTDWTHYTHDLGHESRLICFGWRPLRLDWRYHSDYGQDHSTDNWRAGQPPRRGTFCADAFRPHAPRQRVLVPHGMACRSICRRAARHAR